MGGFSEESGSTYEDWEMFSKSVLKGYTLEMVPEPLLYYRASAASLSRSTVQQENKARALRPYLEAVQPHQLANVIRFAAATNKH